MREVHVWCGEVYRHIEFIVAEIRTLPPAASRDVEHSPRLSRAGSIIRMVSVSSVCAEAASLGKVATGRSARETSE